MLRKVTLMLAAAAAASVLAAGPVAAQDTLKIGASAPKTGPLAGGAFGFSLRLAHARGKNAVCFRTQTRGGKPPPTERLPAVRPAAVRDETWK